MKKNRHCLTFDEWNLILHSLNVLKTKMLSEGKYTDVVDDTLFKVMTARIRKMKIA